MIGTGSRGGGISRREVLRLMAAGAAATFVASCGSDGSPAGSPSRTPSAGGGPPGLPTEDAELRWLTDPAGRQFFDTWFERYSSEHPNISIVLDPVPWEDSGDVVSLGVQNGSVHDVFRGPPGTPAQLVEQGWVAPLDDYIPNIEEWKSRFKPAALARSIYDGKVYGVPVNVNAGMATMLVYNPTMLADAGYDPVSSPMTWDDLRDAARKITRAGDGDHYGFVIAGALTSKLTRFVGELAARAGSGSGAEGIDWRTGEYNLTTDEHLGALELLLAMADDGSILPGFRSLNGPNSNEVLPQGAAGMVLGLAVYASELERNHADFEFGVSEPPAPDQAAAVPVDATPGAAIMYWAYADSPNLAVAGDMLSWLGSPEGCTEYFNTIGIANSPAFDGVLEQLDLSDLQQRTAQIQDEAHRTGPSPELRNPDVSTAMKAWKPPTPDFGAILQGVLAGEIDAADGLQMAEDSLNAELDRVIDAAEKSGLDVSREDWVFPNWDPASDYLPEHYEDL